MDKIEDWEIAQMKDAKFRIDNFYKNGTYMDVTLMFEDLKKLILLLEKHMVKNENNKIS